MYAQPGYFSVLKFKQDRAQAVALARSISSQVCAATLREKRNTLSVNRLTRVLEKAFLQASNYQAQQRMGFVRRGVFVHAFQWALKDSAYPADFVLMATEGLVVSISPKPGGARGQTTP